MIGLDCWPTAEGQNRANTHSHTLIRMKNQDNLEGDLWRSRETSGRLEDAERGPIRQKFKKSGLAIQ